MILALTLAFLAACANATSSLLQRAANKQSTQRALLLRPLWMLGFSVSLVSFLLQAAALQAGSLATVQTVLALELALTVMGAGVFFKARIGWREWLSISLLIGGTVGLIAALDPRQATASAVVPAWQWVVALGLSGVIIAGSWLVANRLKRESYEGALLGIATGVAFGVAASLLKAAMLILHQKGFAHLFVAWQVYAAAAVGLFAFWLLQRALRTGALVASQPGITLADPFVAIAWGAMVYGEQMNGGVAVVFAVVAALALTGGAVLLARSPALKS